MKHTILFFKVEKMRRNIVLAWAVFFLLTGCTKDKLPADLIITNAKVYTVNSSQNWAEAIAIRGERILFVGSAKKALRSRGPRTKVIDAGERLVLPGIHDSHVHFVGGSESLTRIDLSGTRDVKQIQERIRSFAQQHPDAAWIQGRGWMYGAFPGDMPHKKFLDEVVPDRPAIMRCADGHTTWVNSQALALARIDRHTPDPENGKIVRDEKGEPTGALLEEAGYLVSKIIPRSTPAMTLSALRQGLREAARFGIVRVHGLGGEFENFKLIDQLRQEGNLTVRFSVAMWVEPPGPGANDWQAFEEARYRYNDEWLSVCGVKLMLDGVIDSMTGAMLEPYEGQGDNRGKLFWEPELFKKAVVEINSIGIPVSVHAIGDAAIRLALDACELAVRSSGHQDLRNKIEHVENIAAEDIPRFGKLGVIASFQPLHANPDPTWMGAWVRNVGPEREQRAFAWKSVLSAGGRLAFGSDWPVVTINPWPAIQVAVTRQDFEGRPVGGWLPEQKLGLQDAIYAYTLGGAYATYREKEEGSIEAGKLADLIMLSQNIFEVDPSRISETSVVLTIVGGRIVFDGR